MVLFSGCLKDRLKGDEKILIGVWNWVYTEYTYYECNPPSQTDILTPITENKTASIEFSKKGIIKFNGADKKRVVFWYWKNTGRIEPSRKYEFGILLDNKKNQGIGGWVGADTLILGGSYKGEAFSGSCNGCCDYVNYYIKQ